MKKQLLLLLPLAFGATLAHAQLAKTAQPDSIIKVIPIDDGRHTAYVYTIGGKLQTPEEVKLRLLNYKPSADEFAMAKTNATWSYVSLGGFALSVAGAAYEFQHNDKLAGATTGIVNGQADFIYQHHNHTGAYIFTTAATGFLVSWIVNTVHAVRHGKRALYLYNQRFE